MLICIVEPAPNKVLVFSIGIYISFIGFPLLELWKQSLPFRIRMELNCFTAPPPSLKYRDLDSLQKIKFPGEVGSEVQARLFTPEVAGVCLALGSLQLALVALNSLPLASGLTLSLGGGPG